MKTIKVPVWFGTLHGDEIGQGTLEETESKTIVTIELDTASQGNVMDLLRDQLIGFAVVVNTHIPSTLVPEEKN